MWPTLSRCRTPSLARKFATFAPPRTRDLAQRFGAPGEFARSHVIAHEIGYHVQNQIGITERKARSA
jgi:hypothetical protein